MLMGSRGGVVCLLSSYFLFYLIIFTRMEEVEVRETKRYEVAAVGM
jgi:hypothetical protein